MTSIGLDLGGTKISSALFDESGDTIFKRKVDLSGAHGPKVGKLITSQVEAILEEAYRSHLHPTGIGICVPGIAHRSGEVWAPNIKDWGNYPLKTEVETFFNHTIPVFIDSDRACHIMAEVWKGAAKNCRDAVFLAVGTGIGAGILSDGRILRGAHDISGAIGWMALKAPFQLNYLERGCFETFASGYGIAEVARLMISKGQKSILSAKLDQLTTNDVFEAYEQGDPVALHVIDDAIQLLGMAAANLVSLLNPEKVIFGGGVFGPASKYINRIYAEALLWGQPISMKQVSFEPTQLDGDAGLIGAGYLASKAGKL